MPARSMAASTPGCAAKPQRRAALERAVADRYQAAPQRNSLRWAPALLPASGASAMIVLVSWSRFRARASTCRLAFDLRDGVRGIDVDVVGLQMRRRNSQRARCHRLRTDVKFSMSALLPLAAEAVATMPRTQALAGRRRWRPCCPPGATPTTGTSKGFGADRGLSRFGDGRRLGEVWKLAAAGEEGLAVEEDHRNSHHVAACSCRKSAPVDHGDGSVRVEIEIRSSACDRRAVVAEADEDLEVRQAAGAAIWRTPRRSWRDGRPSAEEAGTKLVVMAHREQAPEGECLRDLRERL